MARLDVFVCDKCAKQVINSSFNKLDEWVEAKFPYVLDKGLSGSIGAPRNMLLCPTCVRDIQEPHPREASK